MRCQAGFLQKKAKEKVFIFCLANVRMRKKSVRGRWIILGLFVVALVLFALNFNKIIPSANQSKNVSEPWVDPAIQKEFEKGKEWVRIIVYVSPIEKVDYVLTTLPSSEFKLKRKWEFFSGEITRQGLEILKNSRYVIKIEYSHPLVFW